jgi:hypothetical protein
LSRICFKNDPENEKQETYLRDTIRVNTIGKPERVKADRKKERQVENLNYRYIHLGKKKIK